MDDGVNRKWEVRHTAGPFETSGEMTFSVSVSDLADNGPVTSTSLINDLDGSGVTYIILLQLIILHSLLIIQ